MGVENLPRTIWWDVDEKGIAGVYLIDQSRLPLQGDVLCCHTEDAVCQAISTMALRGAPALGVGAAMAIAVWSENESEETTPETYLATMDKLVDKIAGVRPTAANLSWGAHEVSRWAHEHALLPLEQIKTGVVELAKGIRDDDEARCRAIGANGAELFSDFSVDDERGGARILTHCNAGSLATAFYGTALGVVYSAFEKGYLAQVWVDETRPVNQGARLTAWELMKAGVPSALICDDMAACVMQQGWVNAVVVGADCICANGDVVNKIGTYSLAVLAYAHNIPFYVAAPNSTIDLTKKSGEDVTIEQRDAREVEGIMTNGIINPNGPDEVRALDLLTDKGPRSLDMKKIHELVLSRKGGGYELDAWMRVTPPNVVVFNPGFDATPAMFVTKIITEKGVFDPADIAQSVNG